MIKRGNMKALRVSYRVVMKVRNKEVPKDK